MRARLQRAALWVWQKAPFPEPVRWAMLWVMNTKYLAGVIAVVLNDAGQVLLLRHTYRPDRAWGLPAGWLRGREDPAQALRRELAEESGLSAEVLYSLCINPGTRRPQLDIVYVCRPAGGVFRPSSEVDACGWFPLDRLPDVPEEQRELIRRAAAGRAVSGGAGASPS